jgi:hypothetical protein
MADRITTMDTNINSQTFLFYFNVGVIVNQLFSVFPVFLFLFFTACNKRNNKISLISFSWKCEWKKLLLFYLVKGTMPN